MRGEFKMLVDSFHMPAHTLEAGNFTAIKNLSPYNLQQTDEPYLVNSFEEIGWTDPFPHE